MRTRWEPEGIRRTGVNDLLLVVQVVQSTKDMPHNSLHHPLGQSLFRMPHPICPDRRRHWLEDEALEDLQRLLSHGWQSKLKMAEHGAYKIPSDVR